VLKKTLEHIQIWRDRNIKRSLIAIIRPSHVIAKLQNDERKMSQQTIELLFALSAANFTDQGRPKVRQWIRNHEVADFWEKQIGFEVTTGSNCFLPR